MEDTIALIDQLIEEHKVMTRRGSELKNIANDIEVKAGLEKARDAFMPGRFDQKKGLEAFENLLVTYGEFLDAHFNREETALLKAFEKNGNSRLVSALRTLLDEHTDLRNRIQELKKHTVELLSGELASHYWSARAHDMRVYMSYTTTVLGVHARNEYRLFTLLKKQLQEAGNE